MGSKKGKPEEERPRLRLDDIARSGRMRVYDQKEVDTEQERIKSHAKKGLIKSLGKRAKKLKRPSKDSTDDEIRKLLESDDFGAPQSKIRFSPVKRPGDDDSKDISSLWSEQEKIRKDEEKLEQSYKQAKQQAKALKKQLLKTHIGDGVAVNLADKTSGIFSHVSDAPLKALRIIRGKKNGMAVTLEARPEGRKIPRTLDLSARGRAPQEPVAAQKTRTKSKRRAALYKKRPSKRVIAFGVVVLLVVGGVKMVTGGPDSDSDNNGTLGAQVSSGSLPEEKPSFSILYPQGKSADNTKTARVSPNGSAPAYAYTDGLENISLKVTQQELPERLQKDADVELEKIAKDFQASSIIQVDENKIYHGYNEKTHVQSLIFIKNKRLVFIAASEKISDDSWASYFLSLQ